MGVKRNQIRRSIEENPAVLRGFSLPQSGNKKRGGGFLRLRRKGKKKKVEQKVNACATKKITCAEKFVQRIIIL